LGQSEFLSTTITPARNWRTRADPFKKVSKLIRRQLQTNPNLDAKTLFADLQRKHPGKFRDGQLRTLQRRVRSWRAIEGPGKKVLVSGRPDQTSIWAAITDVQIENPHQRAFLSAFERSCCIGWAAQAARIDRRTHYHWMENDCGYAAVFKQVQLIAGDTLESAAFERAVVGWTEPVFFRGEKCGERRKYDNAMLMLLLRAWKPEVYGNRVQIRPSAVAAPAPPPPQVRVIFVSAAEDNSARKSSSVERQGSPQSTVQPENSIATAATMMPEAAGAAEQELVPEPEAVVGDDFPKSDQEIIALTRRFLRSAEATANLSKDRDRSRIVALSPERPYPKCAWL
jgi:hypothetical protein